MERRIKVMKNFLNKEYDNGTQRTNCFTDGKKVYSYGTHYALGEWTGIEDADGREILLVNKSRYSNTTSRMQAEFESALFGVCGARIVPHNDGDIIDHALSQAVSGFRNIRYRLRWYTASEAESSFYEGIQSLRQTLEVYELLENYSGVSTRLDKGESSLQEIRSGISGMDERLKAVIYQMAIRGTEPFDKEIEKMPVQYAIIYKLMGGTVEIKKAVKNPVWNYLWLKDHLEPEEAIKFLNDSCKAIRDLASSRLTTGAVAC